MGRFERLAGFFVPYGLYLRPYQERSVSYSVSVIGKTVLGLLIDIVCMCKIIIMPLKIRLTLYGIQSELNAV